VLPRGAVWRGGAGARALSRSGCGAVALWRPHENEGNGTHFSALIAIRAAFGAELRRFRHDSRAASPALPLAHGVARRRVVHLFGHRGLDGPGRSNNRVRGICRALRPSWWVVSAPPGPPRARIHRRADSGVSCEPPHFSGAPGLVFGSGCPRRRRSCGASRRLAHEPRGARELRASRSATRRDATRSRLLFPLVPAGCVAPTTDGCVWVIMRWW
jgi:hypothetical protein